MSIAFNPEASFSQASLDRFQRALCRPAALAFLLKMSLNLLERLAQRPQYRTFQVPKGRDGSYRLIEDPEPVLKQLQRRLNHYLQAIYYLEKPHASYGFVIQPHSDKDKRNILSNARRHLNNPWLIQTDLADFFHQITARHVREIFTGLPFMASPDVATLLTALTTHAGRLPMGAPTSPALSNFACRSMDEGLYALAEANGWVYSRYADDLSFSARMPLGQADLCRVVAEIERQGFRVNPEKTRLLGPEDDKIVTGILLRGNGELQPGTLEQTRQEVQQLSAVVASQHFHGELRTHWVEKMKQRLRGRIAFIGFVLGKRHPDYIALKDQYYTACSPPEELFGAVSWKVFNYL